jgi:4-diphosphocytidyl-2-C-methyl-D-erythritol kinase
MRRSQLRVAVRAHAKVNLDLRVIGSRPDGYHELRTIFQTVALHDTIVCAERPGPFTIECKMRGVPRDRTNLVWKAASALWAALDRDGDPVDTTVTIEKAIPIQAGLGGGSADAAAALRGLARLWGGASDELLQWLAEGLGSDVPFFLFGGTALALGRGEELYPLVDLPPHAVAILKPSFGVSTPDAYGWYDEDRAAGVAEAADVQTLAAGTPARTVPIDNDLEPPVFRRRPAVRALRDSLRKSGAIAASMSGSGSAVFGLFPSRAAARKAVAAVPERRALGIVTRTISRGEYEHISVPRVIRR